jgi:hypothetical protein
MKSADLLFSLMQVAVTLAGFTGVITLIDRGAARVSDELVSLRVRRLVIAALLVVVLATTPFVANLFGFPEDQIWRWGCLAEGASITAYLIALEARVRRLTGPKALGISYLQYYGFSALGVLILFSLLAGFLGYVPAAGSYAAGVFLFVLAVGIFFVRLVFMLDDSWRNRRQADRS